jgi:hypothetical protein
MTLAFNILKDLNSKDESMFNNTTKLFLTDFRNYVSYTFYLYNIAKKITTKE